MPEFGAWRVSMNTKPDKIFFWGCFIAIITTSYAFISRMILCGGQFASDFALDKVAVGELQGAGIWPFGVSIIVFSLFIDRIGYKVAMVFSFVSYLVYMAMAVMAYQAIQGVTGDALVAAQNHGHQLLYWGSIILGLGNGSVEAYANPIISTMFSNDKTKWLNRLHAGWPGGLVIGGLCTIALANNPDWRINLGLILIPAVIFFLILIGKQFPKSEREQAGVGYVQMLKELGVFGALVGFGLVFAQLGQVFGWSNAVVWGLTAAVVVIFAVLTKSFGRFLLAFLIIIMMPQATTELGTNGWITSLMEGPMKAAGYNPAWVLVYTSAIMLVLRFCAGPLIHKFSPVGLLLTCSALAGLGILALSQTAHSGPAVIFAAATLFGIGITFFWPTTLGLTSEQCPKGGALTLNAMGGIGMLAVGILGAPFLGYMQETSTTQQLRATDSALYEQVKVQHTYLLGAYEAIDPVKSAAVTDDKSLAELKSATTAGQFTALGKMAMFPAFTFACYLALLLYFKSRGGYKPVTLRQK
ncbi:MAG TPA: MFS transporter [Candidatus Sulfotelmatobacter sp.]|jgi:MFS family permease|nr:MFS transporter [Candidatus Sulfotelmatobacter sp.]